MTPNKILQSYVAKGKHELALAFSKQVKKLETNQVVASSNNEQGTLVVAFDLRFNLNKPGYKYLYLLDNPFFDKNYELVKEDGTKELLNNDKATQILKEELRHNEEVIEKGDKAKEQLKKVKQFANKGGLVVSPPPVEPVVDESQLITTAPETEESDEDDFDNEP